MDLESDNTGLNCIFLLFLQRNGIKIWILQLSLTILQLIFIILILSFDLVLDLANIKVLSKISLIFFIQFILLNFLLIVPIFLYITTIILGYLLFIINHISLGLFLLVDLFMLLIISQGIKFILSTSWSSFFK